ERLARVRSAVDLGSPLVTQAIAVRLLGAIGEARRLRREQLKPRRDLLAELAASGEWSTPMQGHNITEEMRAAAAHPRFATVPASLHLDAHTAERLAATALRVYASSDDFTALHGVTGLAALDALRPYLDNQLGLDRYAFQALAAAYLSFGAPALWSEDRLGAFASSNPVPPTATEFAGANSDDEHVAKLVYSAHRAWRSSGDPLYLAVAARKAGLFDTRRPDRRPVARRAVS
ncbi:MAG: DUF4243 domain-containing protein, partial [Acidobacteriota bacterium]|nr:DUF4243 domain-containing protein [Acidobacteriota bacterium]